MVSFVEVDDFEIEPEDHVLDSYRDWRDDEGVPVHTGLVYCDDLNDLATGPWDRTGQDGAIVNLYGSEGVNDLHVHDLNPQGETKEQYHFFDEIVYVTQGRGMTIVGEGDRETSFEWQSESLFHIPPNTPYRHINLSDDEPARLMGQTPLPYLLHYLEDEDFVFNSEYDMWGDDYRDDYYSDSNLLTGEEASEYSQPVVWEANFVPDIQKFDKLGDYDDRGAGGLGVRFPMHSSTMWAHISEFPVGTYKKDHRHGPGAVVSILSGEGYSVIWREGMEERVKIDWSERSVFAPPAGWFHQHFNTGSEPARYFAIHRPRLGALTNSKVFSTSEPSNQIEYVEEDPAVRDKFEEELAKKGLESKMPDECYTDPDYKF